MISLIVLTISACANNTIVQSQHFLLPYPEHVTVIDQAPTMPSTVRLKSISLPSYLQKQNIVLVNQSGQVFQAANNFWAESLENQLEGITLTYFSDRLPTINWLSPAQYQVTSPYLTIHLEKFFADPDGHVSVSGYWTLWSQDNRLIKQKRFQYQSIMAEDGYLAMTQSLSTLWFESVLDNILVALRQL